MGVKKRWGLGRYWADWMGPVPDPPAGPPMTDDEQLMLAMAARLRFSAHMLCTKGPEFAFPYDLPDAVNTFHEAYERIWNDRQRFENGEYLGLSHNRRKQARKFYKQTLAICRRHCII